MTNLAELLGVSLETVRQATNKPNNITRDRFDERLYQELYDASPHLQELDRQASGNFAQGVPTFPALLQDLWGAFYKADPELTPDAQVDPAHRVNRPFVQRVLEDPNTAQTRITTMLDELGAGIATIAAGKVLYKEMMERPDLREAMNKAREAANKEELAARAEAGGMPKQAEKKRQEAQQLVQGAEQMLQQVAKDVRMAVRAASEKAQEESNEAMAALGGWGLGPGDTAQVPMDQRLRLVERLRTPRLRQLSDLVGRFRNLARAKQKEKVQKERDEVHNITIGNDLARVLPAELAMLKHPLMRRDFYRRFTEGQLLQYALRTKERKGRGPLISLIDTSGSMRGQPADWAVATAMALVDTAARQKRQSAALFFDDAVHTEVEFAPGERDVQKLLTMATIGASGGTDYKPALNAALATITYVGYEKADVVMITDGLCFLDETFLATFKTVKEALGFRAYVVMIASAYARREEAQRELAKWADHIWIVHRLDEQTAGEIFEEVY